MDSKLKIQTAFLALLEQRNGNEITMLDIAKAAKISRTTLYSKYESTTKIYEDIRNNVMNQLNKLKEQPITEQTICNILNQIKSHPNLFLQIVKDHPSFLSIISIQDLFENTHVASLEKIFTDTANTHHIERLFFVSGCTIIIVHWILAQYPISIEKLSSHLINLAIKTNIIEQKQ